jgi:hypothetical protein
MKMNKFLYGIFLMPLLAGCVSPRAQSVEPPTPLPTPTLNTIFVRNQEDPVSSALANIITPRGDLFIPTSNDLSVTANIDSMVPTQNDQALKDGNAAYLLEADSTALPGGGLATPSLDNPVITLETEPVKPTPDETPTPSPTATPEILPTVLIYDDNLNNNWYLSTSQGIKYYLQNKTIAHNGSYAMALTPTRDYGNLVFTVKANSKDVYLREQTLGIRFWLYTGEATVGTDDLIVSVIGSNKYPYWRWNDTSVTNENDPTFPETRLYYLDFNDAIPPQTWVQVEVWLDKLVDEPEYTYVTGIVIKNGVDFRDTIYIDQVELVKTPGSP